VLNKTLQSHGINDKNLRVLKIRYFVEINALDITFMCVCVSPYSVYYKELRLLIPSPALCQ
jgi:hypothetical protein